MSRPPIGSSWFHAGAVVLANGTTLATRHCTVVRPFQGVYEVTLEQGIDSLVSVAFVNVNTQGRGDVHPTVIHVSDTQKDINILEGLIGNVGDFDFTFTIKRVRTS